MGNTVNGAYEIGWSYLTLNFKDHPNIGSRFQELIFQTKLLRLK